MNNKELSQLLLNVAAAMKLKKAFYFRIIAYEKAADSIQHLTSELKDIWDDGKLDELPGIGPNIASHLDELFRTGKSKHFDSMMEGLPKSLFTLLLVPGLGPKKAYQLTKKFHIIDPKTAVDVLEKIAKKGLVAKLPGWGAESQKNVLSAIETYRRGQIKENRMPLPFADLLAGELISYLKKIPGVMRVDVLGSLRRKVATIGDIDLAAATTKPALLLETFVKYPKVKKIIDHGPKGATVLLSIGRQVDLRVQNPRAYGAMLQYFTGSKHHNIKLRELALKKGFSLNEHGIKLVGNKSQISNLKSQKFNEKLNLYEFDAEEKFYEAIGLPWIPPEIREDRGEVEIALQKKLPSLVTQQDIKGDLHIHSNFDLKPSHDLGSSSLGQILDEAEKLNYEYVGISDHNPKAMLEESQIVEIMHHRQESFNKTVTKWQKDRGKKLAVFTMLEVDITPRGDLALPEKAFAHVDAVVISVHSVFNQPKVEMTKRVLTAFSHPKAKIWGHPTARLIGKREGIDIDWIQIFEFCAKNEKALEINSWPERLDLPDLLVRDAIKAGVRFTIDTDSHAAEQLTGIKYGVDVARRGWAEKKDILNTLGYNEFRKWIEK